MSTEIGETLRTAREDQGRSVEEVAQVLRMRSDYVRALEDERFEVFGGDIYARGFLRNYATELGIDPQPLLDDYRREHGEQSDLAGLAQAPSSARTSVSPRSSPPPWIAWVLVAVIVIAGLAYIGTLGSGRTPGQASPDPTTAPPPPAESQTETEEPEATEEPTDEPEAEPEPEPTFEGVEVVLALEEDSWMRVVVDGGVELERLVAAGETLQFPGEEEVVVRLGNAGGVRAQVNGEEVDSLGARGEVVEVRFTESGVEPV
ncbi:MAG: RodZ domain-containing protein [Egicoccus sp.]